MYSTANLQTLLFCAAVFKDGFEILVFGFIFNDIHVNFKLLCRLKH